MGLEDKCTKLTSEVDALREGNQVTLQMCLEMTKQKQMLEDKYNARLEKTEKNFELDFKLKPLPNEKERNTSAVEKKSIHERVMEDLVSDINSAYYAVNMALCSKEIKETKIQNIMCDAESQTVIRNIKLKLIQDEPITAVKKRLAVHDNKTD